MKENTELDELQRRLHDAHESSAMLRDKIDRLESQIINKVYLLQFFEYSHYDTHTIGVYSSIENILQIDTEKEFKLSDGEYRIVGFILDSTKAKTLKTRIVWSNGTIEAWKDKVVD